MQYKIYLNNMEYYVQGKCPKAAQNLALEGTEQNGISGGEAGRNSYACSCHVHFGTESEEESAHFL